MSELNHYTCQNLSLPAFPEASDPCWERAPRSILSDTVSGKTPFLLTEFRLLRSDTAQAFFLRFLAEDDIVQSTFRLHEECLYRQDVLEVFITEGGDMQRYKEIEVSPYDLHFTASVDYLSPNNFRLDMDWDIPCFITKTRYSKRESQTVSLWRIPYGAFSRSPQAGASWRFNAFRIDHSARGVDLQAWQTTGVPNFHIPERFGFLDFER
jgi:hypothetical protein